MNQILDYDTNNGSGNSNNTDNIVRVFAILLIIFALALIGVVVYRLNANKNDETEIVEQKTEANIEVEINDAQATIKVAHDKNIDKIIYSWNTSSERTIKGTGKYMEESIDVPAGENVLHIKVIDEVGAETTYEEDVTSEEGVDIINPVIDLSVTDEKKLKIVATDETSLDFITYRWNEEDEQQIYANEDSKEVTTEIEILKGENDLTVVAVDKNNNITTETKTFTGLTKPEIKAILSDDGKSVEIVATHENGIESVQYNFNDVDYNVDIGTDNPKQIQFPQELQVGNNKITLIVKSVDGTETRFDATCPYGNTEDNSAQNNSTEENTSNE